MVNFPAPVCLLVQIHTCKTNRRANFGAANATIFLKRAYPIRNVSGKQTN